MPNRTPDDEMPSRYARALAGYLAAGGETALHEAYELGHEALLGEIGLLQLASIHQVASTELLGGSAAGGTGAGTGAFVEKTGRFLLEALAPFEMMQIGHRDSNKALRSLNLILEEEAGRIAHALHDDAAQLLATTYLELAAIERTQPPKEIGEHVRRIRSHLDQVSSQLRHISHELRSPILDQFGLVPALKFLAEGVQKRTGLAIEIEYEGEEETLPKSIESALYRAAMEALNNITRHAKASRASITVQRNAGTVQCTIRDDGVGFVPGASGDESKSSGLGLLGIRERARSLHGSFRVESTPGRGSTLHIEIPLEGAQT
ncbi:MAG: histidine kinase [Gammaproteobacteria bacterium]|nr:histidine kinase [Gammaproteobacteria bacterium]